MPCDLDKPIVTPKANGDWRNKVGYESVNDVVEEQSSNEIAESAEMDVDEEEEEVNYPNDDESYITQRYDMLIISSFYVGKRRS
ncbi:hypothetical protein DFA_02996 [Cavenderia fasciculata]|uniref:Uncharacterized protein n=1 Tax=Cavenderia fasciculata TaxID=261658 RepID=F4PGB8_CACFS|nr:uncharacterized protein DFA_02996 [Cavenderia fasciculata]EGG24752.1 hypothetical protein DFA_02996 [Cavenderia fasciculata]|eukprot:XP_004362603.1 hypothetical protein DFA_02996 [Cavenderia fasciculata]